MGYPLPPIRFLPIILLVPLGISKVYGWGYPPPVSIFPIILCNFLSIKPSTCQAGLYSQIYSVYKMTEDKRREGLDDLTSFLNVNDDGILNDAVNEERTQLERTEVEDERVKRDPLMELMEMKRKQGEQRKRYREKHPEIFLEQKRRQCKKHPEVIRDQNRRYRLENREKLTEIKRKKYRESHPEGVRKHENTAIRRAKKKRPPEGVQKVNGRRTLSTTTTSNKSTKHSHHVE